MRISKAVPAMSPPMATSFHVARGRPSWMAC